MTLFDGAWRCGMGLVAAMGAAACGQVATSGPDASAAIDAASSDAAADLCPGPDVACGGACIDPSTDEQYCGASGNCEGPGAGETCGADSTCVEGACSYSPVGPQFDIEETAIDGWTLCHTSTYEESGTTLIDLLGACAGDDLLLGCRPTGATAVSVLAWAPRGDVLTDTGQDATTTHTANGTAWYFNDSYSWGFAAEGDVVNKSSCDYMTSGPQRLCWHTTDSYLDSGYRCGDNVAIGADHERLIYTR